eukprot:13351323-Alexandrium_andersonii.AAC.1
MQWPGGAWKCGLCGGKNTPSELFCQSVDGGGRCRGSQQSPGSEQVVWRAKPAHQAHQPPSQ